MKKSKVVLFGLGYVGYSISLLLSKSVSVYAIDIDSTKVQKIKKNIPLFKDKFISDYLKNNDTNINASTNLENVMHDADFFIICTPTDLIKDSNNFDLSSIYSICDQLAKLSIAGTVVIKSTVPIGFTDLLNKKYSNLNILFSPEFLREGNSLHDNLYPSRIVVGGLEDSSRLFANLLISASNKKDAPKLICSCSEAEAIKLFSNTYLATRVAFFNELDTFSIKNGLDTKMIIDGLSLDPRIGKHYNNPSFGYGGYCLPKDTKQLEENYQDIPQRLISAVIKSNEERKRVIANEITNLASGVIGFFKINMKKDSDNFRESSVIDIIKLLKNDHNKKIIIYEPLLDQLFFESFEIVNDFNEFVTKSDLIVTNRMYPELNNYSKKVYTRDIYLEN